jgi:hypothetical protein
MESQEFQKIENFLKPQDNLTIKIWCGYLHRVNNLLITHAQWSLRPASSCIQVDGAFSMSPTSWGNIYFNQMHQLKDSVNQELKLPSLWSSPLNVVSMRCRFMKPMKDLMVCTKNEEASLKPHQPLAGGLCRTTCDLTSGKEIFILS